MEGGRLMKGERWESDTARPVPCIRGGGENTRTSCQDLFQRPDALTPTPTPTGGLGLGLDSTSDMVEREARRLEVLRRRQERELQQLIEHEVTRRRQLEKAESKVAMLERRAEEQRRTREAAAEEWGRQQWERALAKKKARRRWLDGHGLAGVAGGNREKGQRVFQRMRAARPWHTPPARGAEHGFPPRRSPLPTGGG